MKISMVEILNEKAKRKKDGVYSHMGIIWVVKNGRFIAYSNTQGECFQRFGFFDTKIGKVPYSERRERMLEWIVQHN